MDCFSPTFADTSSFSCHVCLPYYVQTLRVEVFFDKNTRAHEVSTSKQHKSISASDVFKALELIEFADLIPPLQAELQGTLRALYLHRSHVSQTLPRLLTAYPIHSCFSLPRASQEQKSIVWGGRVL
jgi:hypothetical protein